MKSTKIEVEMKTSVEYFWRGALHCCSNQFGSFSFLFFIHRHRPGSANLKFVKINIFFSSVNARKWRIKRTRTLPTRATTIALSTTNSLLSHLLPCLQTNPAKGKYSSRTSFQEFFFRSSYPLHVQQSPCGRPMTSQLTGLYASPYQRNRFTTVI